MVVDTLGRASHSIIEKGITILERLLHRGATGCDPETGDGAGMLMQIPHEFFSAVTKFKLPAAGHYAVGMFFLPKDKTHRAICRVKVEEAAAAEGFTFLGWRTVPVDESKIGRLARESAPVIEQCFVAPQDNTLAGDALERRLYILRRVIEHGTLEDIFENTRHPYTEGLFNSLPNLEDRQAQLKPIKGLMPDPSNLPKGCAFCPRCDYAMEICKTEKPKRVYRNETHYVECHLYNKDNIQEGKVGKR